MIMKDCRAAYMNTLIELAEEDKSIVALEADVGRATFSFMFKEKYPGRYFQMSIAEQNMLSVAAGMALTGKKAFVHAFSIFTSGRAWDQLRQGAAMMKLNVKICGSSAGFSDIHDGSSHQTLEDLALIRVVPNMTLLVPCDYNETARMVKAMAKHDGPVYLRINRFDMPVITPEGGEYEIGKVSVLREGSDVVLFANGVMVAKALEAAEMLEKERLSVKVVNVSCMKPLDCQGIIDAAKGCKAIVTAEEHNVINGLGSAVAEALRSEVHAPMEFVGIQDCFGQTAQGYDLLLEKYGLTAQNIYEAAKRMLSK